MNSNKCRKQYEITWFAWLNNIWIQIKNILAPGVADPYGFWLNCKLDILKCSSRQLEIMHGQDSNPSIPLCWIWILDDKIWRRSFHSKIEKDTFFICSWSMTVETHSSGYRLLFLRALNALGPSSSRGYFINSCFAHCQTEVQETWYRADSPKLANKVRN